jgi:hypothetical protein
MPAKPKRIEGTAKLMDCPQQMTSLSMRSPVSERLDRLVERAKNEGVGASRKTVMWALILEATVEANALALMVQRALKADANAAADGLNAADVLIDQRHNPGPRPRA